MFLSVLYQSSFLASASCSLDAVACCFANFLVCCGLGGKLCEAEAGRHVRVLGIVCVCLCLCGLW